MKGASGGFDFPCEISIKLIGRAEPGFADHALALVGAHATAVTAEPERSRASSGGKYSAITLRVAFADRENMTSLHAALDADERILWAM